MSWFSRCSWCGGPFNDGNYRCCTNVSFENEFVCNPDSISNDETPDFSYPPSQPQTSSFDQFHCFGCGYPLEDGVRCQWCTCKWCRYGFREGFCWFCASRDGNSSIDAPNPNSFNDPPNVFTHPPQPSTNHTLVNYVETTLIMVMIVLYGCRLGPHEDYQCQPWHQNYSELNPCYDSNSYGFNQPTQYSIDHQPQSIQEDLNQQRMNDVLKVVQSLVQKLCQQEQASNLSIHTPEPSRHFNSICYDDDDDDGGEYYLFE
ncbi:hypothetical protein Tco_0368416 [Tanacetum coccineum]